jgi:hypothetical protein
LNGITKRHVVGLVGALLLILQVVGAMGAGAETLTFTRKFGVHGDGPEQMYHPWDMAVDSEDDVYVADTQHHRIQEFDAQGNFIASIGSIGQGDGQLYYPEALTIDGAYIFVADTGNHRVVVFGSTGDFIRKWGELGSGNGQFNHPNGIATDSQGNIYVTESQNCRVQKFSPTGTYLTKWGTCGTGDGQFQVVTGVEVGGDDEVYVSDEVRGDIQVFSTAGTYTETIGGTGTDAGKLDYPDEMGICSYENQDGANRDRIYVVEAGHPEVSVFEGSRYLGSLVSGDYRGGGFSWSHGAYCDQINNDKHNFFIVSTNESEILKYAYDRNVDPYVSIHPDTTKRVLREHHVLRLRLEHADMLEKCYSKSTVGHVHIPADRDDPLDHPVDIGVRGSSVTVKPGRDKRYEIPVTKEIVSEANAVFDDGKHITVTLHFSFDGCETGSLGRFEYTIPG